MMSWKKKSPVMIWFTIWAHICTGRWPMSQPAHMRMVAVSWQRSEESRTGWHHHSTGQLGAQVRSCLSPKCITSGVGCKPTPALCQHDPHATLQPRTWWGAQAGMGRAA